MKKNNRFPRISSFSFSIKTLLSIEKKENKLAYPLLVFTEKNCPQKEGRTQRQRGREKAREREREREKEKKKGRKREGERQREREREK